MIGINDAVEKLADDVFIRGIDLSQPFKPMTNNELTIEELKSVSGGVVIRDNDRMSKGKGPEGSGSGETLKDWKKRNLQN